MKNIFKILSISIIILLLNGCGKDAPKSQDAKTVTATEKKDEVKVKDKEEEEVLKTVEVLDINGIQEVPFKPEKVVALDNRTFKTLADWEVELSAVPKDIMPADNPYVMDDSIPNIGNHREPNLEVIAAADPELIIVGQRFGKYTEELKKLCPQAVVIDLNWDVSQDAEMPGDSLVNGLKTSTITLGKIFDKNEEAEKLCEEFDEKIRQVKEVYNPEQTVMAVVVSGGNIGYSAPKGGRVWGPMFEIFGWTPALEIDNSSSDHKGDDVSVEAIADSNPDWIMVLDRDAGVRTVEDSTPAIKVLEGSEALKSVNAIKSGQIILAPADTYTNESIQTYIELFGEMAERFK